MALHKMGRPGGHKVHDEGQAKREPNRSQRRCGAARYFLPGLFDIFLGTIIESGMGDFKDDMGQFAGFFENVSVLTALLLSVFYPTYQHASVCYSNVNANVPGLGDLYFVMSLTSAWGNAICAVCCVVQTMVINGLFSDDEANHLLSSTRMELRVPYFLFVLSVWSSSITILLEGFVRTNHFDTIVRGGGEDNGGEDGGDGVGWLLTPTITLTVFYATFTAMCVYTMGMLAGKPGPGL